MIIKQTLQKALDDRGMTQTELANLTGIKRQIINNIALNKMGVMNYEHFSKIVTALGITDIRELVDIYEED